MNQDRIPEGPASGSALPLYLVLILAALLAYANGARGRQGSSPAGALQAASSHAPAGCDEGVFAATAWACLSAGLETGGAGTGKGRQ
jgi:hypothetical protein